MYTNKSTKVIGGKYGYYPTSEIEAYRGKTAPSGDQVESMLLVYGWGAGNPRTLAREIYTTQLRLQLRVADLRLTFRDTNDFDLNKESACSCSMFHTVGDWLVPFLFVFTSVRNSASSKRAWHNSLIAAVIILGVLPYVSRIFRSDFEPNWRMISMLLLSPIPSISYLWVILEWSVFMSTDFYNRWSRAKFCTNLLDPKNPAFAGRLRKYYRDHVFAGLGKISRIKLKKLDLQTIDIYNENTAYGWFQLRRVLFDVGSGFLKREEMYLGIMIFYVISGEILVLYCSLRSHVYVVSLLDLLFALLCGLGIMAGAVYISSCARALNQETDKQIKILTERIVEMQNSEFNAEDRNMPIWKEELRQAREIIQTGLQILKQEQHYITLFGVKVDTNVIRVLYTLMAVLAYVEYSVVKGIIVGGRWI
ncbi:hypothetical protein RFI_22482 [Reticulomyxa filosa]|uniref:Uncharacterized protein n=1 Tax=Reticulomyxa filosa TaxID=46433 RepID=X6MMP1_RETFI|nr:hypothetical protein RFI_22482 [Reticulomyxa filosa]|eukprot:ETO14886.1 hypothetical protein RFI_22482 [Reticulomyxa filosa]